MTLTLVFLVVATITAFLPGWLDRYVQALPDAPLCPGCRAVTSGQEMPGPLFSLLPILWETVLRECARCGWRGRMRLRLVAEGAGRG